MKKITIDDNTMYVLLALIFCIMMIGVAIFEK